jgi:hypothetical protein
VSEREVMDARREDHIGKLMQKCANFNGFQNARCEVGVVYDELSDTPAAMRRLPCLLQHADTDHVECPKARYPTREEAEAQDAESRRWIQEYMAKIGAGECPGCGSDEWSQVGRCVYCDSCHHRLYQGTLPKDKRKPTPPVAADRPLW